MIIVKSAHVATPICTVLAYNRTCKQRDSWQKAKSLLLGAVDVMCQLKDTGCGSVEDPPQTSSSKRQRLSDSSQSTSASSSTVAAKKPSVYDEHRRLFGYQPSKVYSNKRAKGGYGKGKGKKKAVTTWTKEVICLKECEQETSPSTEEKIELA